MSIKIKKNYSNFNIDTLKLLIAQEDVQKKISILRKDAGIDKRGFDFEKEKERGRKKTGGKESDFQKWYDNFLDKSFDKPPKTKEANDTPYFKLVNGIKEIMRDYGLSEDFYQSILHYVRFNMIDMFLAGNYILQYEPKEKNQIASGIPLSIKLKIYRKLSGKDWGQIKLSIKELEKIYLPPHRKIKTSIKKDIAKDLEVLSLMKSRGVRKEKIYDSQYLDRAKKQYERGKISEKELQEAEEKNKGAIKIKKHKITSKTIAQKLFGTTKAASRVRTINKRIKEEVKKRFKKM